MRDSAGGSDWTRRFGWWSGAPRREARGWRATARAGRVAVIWPRLVTLPAAVGGHQPARVGHKFPRVVIIHLVHQGREFFMGGKHSSLRSQFPDAAMLVPTPLLSTLDHRSHASASVGQAATARWWESRRVGRERWPEDPRQRDGDHAAILQSRPYATGMPDHPRVLTVRYRHQPSSRSRARR